ncbi:WD40 repeat-like protein [Neolentinus lepideus HHB14362 ss-1]|uniref:WD40 repeat-like protein n=1 Tax=Neolentinus lepideus HHB14362 ss-1 TaxID=1314782 RepID=A0A165PNX5_9AGAM|nr:WD40 repeat-like protein [Neolentinus lepideus HHB14362 ss-1]
MMEFKTPIKKRRHSSPFPPAEFSAKRRRLSGIPIASSRENEGDFVERVEKGEGLSDRFISVRPDVTVPLTISPRTERYAQFFGLKGDNILSFDKRLSEHCDFMPLQPLKSHATEMSYTTATIPATSALSNLINQRQALLALDGSGISQDLFSYPLTWSYKNVLAVACEEDIFCQDLNTRVVSKLCTTFGEYRAVEWADRHEEGTLAAGTTTGLVELWKLRRKKPVRRWFSSYSVGGMAWNGHIVAVGSSNGHVTLYDARMAAAVGVITAHQGKVHGVKWSTNWDYLATSDEFGHVHLWDYRKYNGAREGTQLAKVKHDAPVKALAWCSWNTDTLATGSAYPEGTIKIWSVKSLTGSVSPKPAPAHTLVYDTSVTSLIWSPHCKELLSTHGSSWTRPSGRDASQKPVPIISPMSNSVTVSRYPSYGRLISTKSHANPIATAVLSPDGTQIFTVCPKEENMKLWKIWGAPPKEEKENTMQQQKMIR